MSGLYVYPSEADALKAIDLRELEKLVDEAIWQSRSGELHPLRLASCGEYVSGRLYRLDQAILAHNKAKAAKKRAETLADVRRAGRDLVYAVCEMKDRLEREERERTLFEIDDVVYTPRTFTPRLEVRIGYRWREAVDENWTHGAITFQHEVDLRPDYTLPTPKRKPPRWKQEEELQDRLYRTWDHLRSSALHSVREYLKSGRDRTKIPETFRATTDSHSRGLNNYSTQFWRETS
jgi:hypothetical protein